MWFNNILVYQYQYNTPLNFEGAFEDERLKPCPPHARFTYGWLAPFDQQLSHELAGGAVFCLGKEERILPRSVIQRQVTERVKALETTRGFAVKRSERSQLAEDIEFELLPKAFCLQKKLFALIDTQNQWLFINTASTTQSAQLLSLLRKQFPGIQLEPLAYPPTLTLQFTNWIHNPAALPAGFELASDCLLVSLDDEKSRFNCKGGALLEIQTLLSQGYHALELSLIWNERIQFTLTDTLGIKRLKCLDYLQDEIHAIADMDGEEHQLDAKLMLLSGELKGLISAIQNKLINTTTHSTADACVL